MSESIKTWVNRLWERGSWRIAQNNNGQGRLFEVHKSSSCVNDLDSLKELHGLLTVVIADEEAAP